MRGRESKGVRGKSEEREVEGGKKTEKRGRERQRKIATMTETDKETELCRYEY